MSSWKDKAVELKKSGVSWTQLPAELEKIYNTEFTFDQVRNAVRRHKLYGEIVNKGSIEYEDKRPEPTREDIDRLYHSLVSLDDILSATDTKQTRTTFRIDDNKPIGICHWGDWHIFCRGGDFSRFDEDKKTIIETDGLYYIGMGDYKENQLPTVHASGTFEQLATPGVQDLIVKNIIQDTAEKCIALVRGCHDDWDKKMGDKDFISKLCEVAKCVNLWHGGVLTFKFGTQTYKIMARHKYKNESSLNTTNVQRNMMNDFGPCDVFAVAHKHYPDMQVLRRMGQDVVYLRSGSYKNYDEFGQKLAGYEGTHGVPICIYYPNEHKVLPFANLHDGILHLKALREN